MRENLSVKRFVTVLAVVCLAASAGADVKLPAIFGDNMVLQRDIAVGVWGWAEVKERVTVTLGDQSKSTAADKDGKWSVKFDAMKAGGPIKMSVKGKNSVEFQNILVGEVWVCSGQSNMAMRVNGVLRAKEEAAAAKWPKIRMMTVPRKSAKTPQDNCGGSWAVCSPKTVAGFSATAYFFGRKLHEELKVPIGLINSSVGGTPIEQWTGPQKSGGLYNAMIAPLVPYAIRGAIWYQGERNARARNPGRYADQLATMIGGWRGVWGQPGEMREFPFLWVQLPNFRNPQTKPVEPGGWVAVQEAMFKTLKVPNTGMAVTIDVGDARNIHPKNKQAVGQRLAIWALAMTYGQTIVRSGPLYKSMAVEGGKVVLKFDHVGGGLVAKGDGKLEGFAIAGADKKFVWADAKIAGETIVVSSAEVKSPVAVRYAWASNPKCNLYNKAHLPASPFRTDNWP